MADVETDDKLEGEAAKRAYEFYLAEAQVSVDTLRKMKLKNDKCGEWQSKRKKL